MRIPVMVLFGALLISSQALAQTSPASPTEQVAIVQGAVVRALNFDRGDLQRLRGARADFTPGGWTQFMKRLNGWLDAKGAPTFSSSFVPSGDPRIVSQSDAVLHVAIPGTLKQSQGAATTTYPIVVEVRASGKPMKIEHLEQSICGGPTATPCQ